MCMRVCVIFEIFFVNISIGRYGGISGIVRMSDDEKDLPGRPVWYGFADRTVFDVLFNLEN